MSQYAQSTLVCCDFGNGITVDLGLEVSDIFGPQRDAQMGLMVANQENGLFRPGSPLVTLRVVLTPTIHVDDAVADLGPIEFVTTKL